jgi:integrase
MARPARTCHRGRRFERLAKSYGRYWLVRDLNTDIYYTSYFDEEARQTRRRTLNTTSGVDAEKIAEQLEKHGVTGDPKEFLDKKPMTLTAEVLDYYKKERVPKIRSGEAATSAIENYLRPRLGNTPVAVLRKRDIRKFQDGMIQEGHTIGYVSRIGSVLRASLNLAVEDEEIPAAPKVPEIRGDAEMEAEELRGRELTILEVAKLFDAISDVHMLDYNIAEINTAARPEAVLELVAEQIDWQHNLFEMNPAGRIQTKKFRPIMRISATWAPWLETVTRGPIVSYRGEAVKSIKTAMRNLVSKAKLPGRVNSTSIRHTLGRYMENVAKVPGREISIFLGHVPVAKKKSTRRYSFIDPYAPEYISNAIAAVEAFVREVNKHTKKWDLEKPYAIKPGWKGRK